MTTRTNSRTPIGNEHSDAQINADSIGADGAIHSSASGIERYVNTIVQGDSLDVLRLLPTESVDLVISSPPYFRQRSYTAHPAEIGREKGVAEYIEHLIAVFTECVRITRPTGSVVFNLGDKYLKGGLGLIPSRFATQAIERTHVSLVNEFTWIKTNPAPRQFARRAVPATEPFFHFAKTRAYYYNPGQFAVKATFKVRPNTRVGQQYFEQIEQSDLTQAEQSSARADLVQAIDEVKSGKLFSFRMKIRGRHALAYGGQPGGRNTKIRKNGYSIIRFTGNRMHRDVIECAVQSIPGARHPAVFPGSLVEFFVKLLTREGAIVVDPFIGSGTTAIVSQRLGRSFIGVELSEEFVEIARNRVNVEIAALGIDEGAAMTGLVDGTLIAATGPEATAKTVVTGVAA